MLLLPTHQEQHYEPLVKQGAASSTATTMISKLKQRKVVVLFLVAAVFGSLHMLRASMARHYGDSAAWAQAKNVAPWIVDDVANTTSSQSTILGVPAQTKTTTTTTTTTAQKDSALTSEIKQTQPPPSTSFSFDPPSSSSSSSSSQKEQPPKSEMLASTYEIAEEEWHIPSDVRFDSSSELWRTRFRPFFRQEQGNIHQEKGFGDSKVDLTDAPFVRRSVYRHLLDSLNSFSHAHDFHFWLAHGSLLGQKWGKKIMSGDTDVDLQCTLGALHRVKKYEKQLWQDRFELLVNPHYLIRKTLNTRGLGRDKNVIDARWIDTMTGFYIDITALSGEKSLLDNEIDWRKGDVAPFETTFMVQDKSPHTYPVEAISPNRRCRFEDMDLWCPNQIEAVLDEEYQHHNLPHFQTWRFNTTIQTFTEVDCPDLVQMYTQPTAQNCDEECRYVVSHKRTLLYKALVMTGDGDTRREGCLLDVTFPSEVDGGKNIKRSYWARRVEGQEIDHRTMRNTEYPAVTV